MSQKSPSLTQKFCFYTLFTYKPYQRNNIFSTIPLWLMENLDFEILKLNLKNFKKFFGAQKWVGAQMSRGPNVSGPKWVGAQMSRGPNVLEPKWVGAQMSWGPNVLGPKWVRAQMSRGPNKSGAQMRNGPKCVPAFQI